MQVNTTHYRESQVCLQDGQQRTLGDTTFELILEAEWRKVVKLFLWMSFVIDAVMR